MFVLIMTSDPMTSINPNSYLSPRPNLRKLTWSNFEFSWVVICEGPFHFLAQLGKSRNSVISTFSIDFQPVGKIINRSLQSQKFQWHFDVSIYKNFFPSILISNAPQKFEHLPIGFSDPNACFRSTVHIQFENLYSLIFFFVSS